MGDSVTAMLFLNRPKNQFERHTNPDGTRGGDVSVLAHVDPSAHVDAGAIVMAHAKVEANEHVRSGTIVLPDGIQAKLS